MFAEKVCEQVVGFSVMAEDEMFEVNGGYQADAGLGGSSPKEDKGSTLGNAAAAVGAWAIAYVISNSNPPEQQKQIYDYYYEAFGGK